ncbi:hypothetical protein HS141_17435 [Cetobacterium somerae]|uniref:hypothetical protein n=1 Tax=Cetobacterium somerae TaxID=188913 RepID=UPI00211E86FB|nr:hypothetical protein [Cetobacterium somerae]MCQ9628637.1 hypothetical protein [Cetobacterium somerae]
MKFYTIKSEVELCGHTFLGAFYDVREYGDIVVGEYIDIGDYRNITLGTKRID